METKRTLLVIGDYCREEVLFFFEDLKNEFNIYFLFHQFRQEVVNRKYERFGRNIFYHEFSSAFSLLRKISPEKVLFFHLETFNQVALLAASKEKGIETIHVEHGFRSYEIVEYLCSLKRKNRENVSQAKKNSLLQRVKNKLFFKNTCLLSARKKDLLFFEKQRKAANTLETALLISELGLLPDLFVSFSPPIFEYYQKVFKLKAEHPVKYIGFIHADKYYEKAFPPVKTKNIIFIDACYHLEKFFGMEPAFVTRFYMQLLAICKKYGYSLSVKKHPRDNSGAIEKAGVKIVDEEEFASKMNTYTIVAGDYSTLFLILLGFEHTAGICFNMFPEKKIDPVKFLAPYKVSLEITDFSQLEELLSNEKNLDRVYHEQLSHKKNYVSGYLFKLDGKSRKRFDQIILEKVNELS